jgi:hypothetical protein
MRKLLIIVLLCLPVMASAQKAISLKKKFFGSYKGTIPSYKMDTGDDVVDVSSSAIYIEITKEDMTIAIGNNALHGTYKVMFMAKTYYLLDVKIDGQLASERIMVYKRGKKLSRDGMYPQPVAELKKYKG